MNELAMNLAAERVHDGYFEVFIVAQAAVADVLCKLLAVQDRFGIALELDATRSRIGTPSFISKKNVCMVNPRRCECLAKPCL